MPKFALFLLVAGLAGMGVGFAIGWRNGGRAIVLIGSINAVIGASVVLGHVRNDLAIPATTVAGLYVLGLLVTSPRASLRNVRVELVLGGIVILAIWGLYFYTNRVATPVPDAVYLGVRALAWLLVGVMMVRVLLKVRTEVKAAARPDRRA